MREPPQGFTRPDYSLPFDLEERLRGMSAARTIKGFLLQGALNAAKEAGKPFPNDRKYTAFKDYPSEESVRLNVALARHLYPNETVQEGLRRLGQRVFSGLSDSILGRVLLGTVGLKLDTALRSVPRIFELMTRNGRVFVVEVNEDSARFHYQDFSPDIIDCYQVGVLEGGFRSFGKTSEIFFRPIAHGEAELWCTWE